MKHYATVQSNMEVRVYISENREVMVSVRQPEKNFHGIKRMEVALSDLDIRESVGFSESEKDWVISFIEVNRASLIAHAMR